MIIMEIKCTMNVMHLNHSETIPHIHPMGEKKLSSMIPVPGAKNTGDHYSTHLGGRLENSISKSFQYDRLNNVTPSLPHKDM